MEVTVEGLPAEVTDQAVKEALSVPGEVLAVNLQREQASAGCRAFCMHLHSIRLTLFKALQGSGIVSFSSQKAAGSALLELKEVKEAAEACCAFCPLVPL